MYINIFICKYNGSVAQLAERALRMREAPGSKPGVSIFLNLFFSGRLAIFNYSFVLSTFPDNKC